MALTLPTERYTPKYGSLCYLAKEGETVETVVVASDEMPAGSVLTDWKELGCIEDGEVSILAENGEPVYCFNATTGLWDQIRTEDSDADTRLQLSLVLQKVTPFLLELAYAAADVNATTGAYVPGSQPGGAVKGWLKVQHQAGTEVISLLDMWVEIKLSEPAKIANRTAGWKPKIQVTQLRSALDAGAFGTTS